MAVVQRRRRAAGALGAVALLVSAVASPAIATRAPWRVRSTLSLGLQTAAISCTSPTACWAVNTGQLLFSADAGQSWTDELALVGSTDISAIQDISCVQGSSRCFLAATTASGPTVVRLAANRLAEFAVPAVAPLAAIVCTSAIRCVATDGTNSYVTTDGAQSWSTNPLATSLRTTPGLDCFHTNCWIVGDGFGGPAIEHSADGGLSWTGQTTPDDTASLEVVRCPSLNTCYAGGAGATAADARIIATRNGGRSWAVESVPPPGVAPTRSNRLAINAADTYSIDCVTATACTAVGYTSDGTIFVVALANGTWTQQTMRQVPYAHYPEVACPAAGTCAVVAGELGYNTTDSGTTWTDQQLPPGLSDLPLVSCPSATHCVSVSAGFYGTAQVGTSDDGAITWTVRPALAGLGTINAVDCPSTTTCMAVSDTQTPGTNRRTSHVIVSQDGGETWSTGRINSATGALTLLSCPSVTTCLAAGQGAGLVPKIMVTTDGGRGWHPVTSPFDPRGQVAGLACGAVNSCVVVIRSDGLSRLAWTTSDLGASWTSHPMPVDPEGLDCVGAYCLAAGTDTSSFNDALASSTDGGATWSVVSPSPLDGAHIGEVSCGSARACAVGATGFQTQPPTVLSTRNAGSTWSLAQVPATSLFGITCAGTACFGSATSAAGNPIIVSGAA